MDSSKPSLRALLLYPEFQQSFWSIDYLCDLQNCKSAAVPLGLLTVGALLPQEWQLRLVDENVQRLTEADWDWAQVVFISAMIVQYDRVKELLRLAKDRGKTVVVGGALPSVMPDEMLTWGADIIIKGEFENLVEPFLQALQAGHLGVVLKSDEKPDLSASPIPRFDLLRLQEYLTLSIQTSRGCPFDCEFCDVVSLFGRKVRHKSPEQVLAELEAIYHLGWRGEIFISDDNFIGNKAFARELLHRLIPWQKSHGDPFDFWTQTSVNLGQQPDLIDLMTEANFNTVFIGIESPDEEILKAAHKHQNVTHPPMDMVNTITANGLTVMGSFILGFDNEPTGTGDRIAAFVESTNLPNVMLNLLVPLPYTRLFERLKREGRLNEDLSKDTLHDLEPTWWRLAYRPTRPEEEILSEYLGLWDRLYDRSNFLSRTLRYYLAMRPTRSALAKSKGEAPSPDSSPKPKALFTTLQTAYHFLRLSWRQGVKSPCRLQYWTQLLEILRRNPSRVTRYLKSCAMGEDMLTIRDLVRQYLVPYLARGTQPDLQQKTVATPPAA